MPNISSLYTGLSGMAAQQRVMDIIGHNVANESTVGYHRQRVELQPVGGNIGGLFTGHDRKAFGVEIVGTTRSIDQLLAARAVREQAGAANASLMGTTLQRIEGIFPEPSDTGLAHQLEEFWGAWSDVANNPGNLATRTQLLERASTLVSSIRRTAADLGAVRDSAIGRVATLAADVNDLAAEVAHLNATIVANPNAANDLLDRRDVLVSKLASLTGAVAHPAENNQVDLYVGGRALVAGAFSQDVDGAGGLLRWAADGLAVNAPSGEAAALDATITDVVPRYLANFDAIASALVTSVNAVHVAGYDQGGTTGRNFFDPAGVTASTIALSVDVAGQPGNIAAGAPVLPGPTAPGPLDGEQARAMALLADSTSGADAQYRSMISSLAVETRAALRRADIQQQVSDAATNDADSVGAVSIDEEMTALVGAQRAYEASARFLTVVDEMLGVLIERTGVVGR